MVNAVVHSHKSDEYATPASFFKVLNDQFSFTLDAAASDDNAKCDVYFTKETDGLASSWHPQESIYINPPYSQTRDWVRRAWDESIQRGACVVMLLAARTDTRWFHEYVYEHPNVHVWFIKGRLRFGGEEHSAPFPSMVVVFGGNDPGAAIKLYKAREAWEARRAGWGKKVWPYNTGGEQ